MLFAKLTRHTAGTATLAVTTTGRDDECPKPANGLTMGLRRDGSRLHLVIKGQSGDLVRDH